MIANNKSELLAVGANSMNANFFMMKLRDAAAEILAETGSEPWASFCPIDVPLIFSTSFKARTQYRSYSKWTRQAISIGRYK